MAEFTLGAIARCHCWVPCRGAIAGVLATNFGGVHVGCHAGVPLLGAIAGVLATNFGGVHVGCHCWVLGTNFGVHVGCHCWGAIAGC